MCRFLHGKMSFKKCLCNLLSLCFVVKKEQTTYHVSLEELDTPVRFNKITCSMWKHKPFPMLRGKAAKGGAIVWELLFLGGF